MWPLLQWMYGGRPDFIILLFVYQENDYLYLGESKKTTTTFLFSLSLSTISDCKRDDYDYELRYMVYLGIRAFMKFNNNDKIEDGWCVYGVCVLSFVVHKCQCNVMCNTHTHTHQHTSNESKSSMDNLPMNDIKCEYVYTYNVQMCHWAFYRGLL